MNSLRLPSYKKHILAAWLEVQQTTCLIIHHVNDRSVTKPTAQVRCCRLVGIDATVPAITTVKSYHLNKKCIMPNF